MCYKNAPTFNYMGKSLTRKIDTTKLSKHEKIYLNPAQIRSLVSAERGSSDFTANFQLILIAKELIWLDLLFLDVLASRDTVTHVAKLLYQSKDIPCRH